MFVDVWGDEIISFFTIKQKMTEKQSRSVAPPGGESQLVFLYSLYKDSQWQRTNASDHHLWVTMETKWF